MVIGCRQRRHIRTMTVSSWLPGSQVGRHRNRPAQVTTADPPGSPALVKHAGLCPRENASGAAPGPVHGTVHGPGYSGPGGISASHPVGPSLGRGFHVYSVAWDPGQIRRYEPAARRS